MNKIKNFFYLLKTKLTLNQIPYLFAGFLFLLYIIYIRLLRNLAPKNINQELYLTENYLLIGFYLFIIFLFLYGIIICIKVILKLSVKSNVITKKFQEFSNKCYETFDYFIKNVLFPEQIGNWIVKLGLFLCKYLNGEKRYFLVALIILPRFLMLTAFMVDIFVFCKFNYIYKVSIILLIPLILKYLEYLLYKFSKNNIAIFDEILFFYDQTQKKRLKVYDFVYAHVGMKNYKIILQNELVYGLTDEYVASLGDTFFDGEKTKLYFKTVLFEEIMPIACYVTVYKSYYKERLMPYLELALNIGYLTCWIYILFYSF